jgi:hypothetical protein
MALIREDTLADDIWRVGLKRGPGQGALLIRRPLFMAVIRVV